MILNFLNPAPYIFWGTVLGPMLLEAVAESAGHVAAFFLGFYGTFVGLMALFVFIFDRLRRLDPRFTRALSLISVGIMVLLGLSFLWQGLSG
jgi:threonine/homoserine/homoserine lactone efflux protein